MGNTLTFPLHKIGIAEQGLFRSLVRSLVHSVRGHLRCWSIIWYVMLTSTFFSTALKTKDDAYAVSNGHCMENFYSYSCKREDDGVCIELEL